MASPASGELSPFGYQVIEITGHSDMWGEYRDLLICKVSVTLHASPESPLSCSSVWRDVEVAIVVVFCAATLHEKFTSYVF